MMEMDPRIRVWGEFGLLLGAAIVGGAKQLAKGLKPRRKGAFGTRRPGEDSPMWNACAVLLALELKEYGSKVRLARYLGISRQRLTDYLTGRRSMPDAEVTLQLVNWLVHKRAGRDLSI